MSEILLGGLLAQEAANIFPNARLSEVEASDVCLEEDLFGMPILERKAGANAVLLRASRLSSADLARLENIQNAYGLSASEISVEWGGQAKSIVALHSIQSGAPLSPEARDILHAVLDAPNAKIAKASVIGGGYRAAAYELASGEHRDLAYTHQGAEQDFATIDIEPLQTGFYKFERFRYQHKRFDGALSNLVTREVLTSGDAVVVLPYDPVLDQIVLIEQMRPAALARRSFDAWGLEAVAGVIGIGEAPQYTVERELEEEAGLRLQGLFPLAPCYQSPGTVSQMMYLYIAGVDLSGYQPGIFGLAEEDEDIRSLLLSREAGIELLKTGEANNAPLQILLYALALRREEIAQDLLAARFIPE